MGRDINKPTSKCMTGTRRQRRLQERKRAEMLEMLLERGQPGRLSAKGAESRRKQGRESCVIEGRGFQAERGRGEKIGKLSS